MIKFLVCLGPSFMHGTFGPTVYKSSCVCAAQTVAIQCQNVMSGVYPAQAMPREVKHCNHTVMHQSMKMGLRLNFIP